MKYGYFDDTAKEYVIETPETPSPWINYLGNNGFFSLISNTGGGYSFFRDAKMRRLTRYRYNNLPQDTSGRMYYIRDGSSIWSPGYMPCMAPLDSFKCRHGLGYTVIESQKEHLAAQLTCFVPLDAFCEINMLTLRNNGSAAKSIQLSSAVEWCLWNATDDMTNYQRNLNLAEVEVQGSTLYHKTEYRERRSHYAFFSVNTPIAGFETDRDAFLGRFGSFAAPAAVLSGKSTNSIASGWYPVASHRIEQELAPGEEKTFIFIVGYVENPPDQKWEKPGVINKTIAEEIIARFSDGNAVASALRDLSSYWEDLLGRFQLKSKEEKLNRMVNIWNQYQCMITFNLSRSASYYESGTGRGMGFRDCCQDILGFVHLIPGHSRQRILDLAAIQFEDGSTYHQYQPLNKQGNADVGTGFSDDPLWLIASTAVYIKETGDSSILNESIPFAEGIESAQPLFEHLRRSIRYTVGRKGPHGLPLIGRADWNDCLNLNCFSTEPGESFQTCANTESSNAESVLVAAMFVQFGGEYAELCRRFGSAEEAAATEQQIAEIKKAVLQNGWDGEWFLRAFDAYENPVGSSACREGKIYIEPQGFCVMAGIGVEEGYAGRALASVEKYLTGPHGIEVLSPAYTEYHKELGEITSYPPGYKENGSIFCHVNPWISIAHARLGNAEDAFNAYRRICPAYTEESSDIHRAEPYVYCQMIAGRETLRYGEAKNSWLTGTASWSFVNISQAILGICPEYDGLKIHPCPPAVLKEYKVTRTFRGTRYEITVHNEQTGNIVVKAEGKVINGNIIPLQTEKSHYEVDVYL